jgi:hypothetical protein
MNDTTRVPYAEVDFVNVGDIVEMKHPAHAGEIYKVVGFGRTKVTIEAEDGTRYKIAEAGVRKTEKAFTSTAPTAPTVWPGTVVEIRPGVKIGGVGGLTGQRFVVLALPSNGKVRLARLGGDNGRYLLMADHAIKIVEV